MTKFYTYKSQVLLKAGEVLKFMKGKGYYAAAAVIVAGGVAGGLVGSGTIGGNTCGGQALGCVTPILGTTTTTTPPGTQANLEVSTSGTDSCTATTLTNIPLAPSHICKTFDEANALATNGMIVAVDGGTYPSDGLTRYDPPEDSISLTRDPGRTSYATFICGNGSTVTTAGRYLRVETQYVKVTGTCFHFHKVLIGDLVTGYFPQNKPCNHIIVDNAMMDIFNISGPCNDVTISNSKIGPSVACYSGTGSMSCQNNAGTTWGTLTYTGEKFYHDLGTGNNDCCTEPKVHAGGENGSTLPQRITITGNQFYGFSSRDPDNGPHAGCLWVGDGNFGGLTVSNNTFNECMTYCMLVNDSWVDNITFTGNTCATPKDAIRTQTDFTNVIDEPGFFDIQTKCSVVNGSVFSRTISNYTWTGNTFATGWFLENDCGNSYSNFNISNNTCSPCSAGQIPAQPFIRP